MLHVFILGGTLSLSKPLLQILRGFLLLLLSWQSVRRRSNFPRPKFQQQFHSGAKLSGRASVVVVAAVEIWPARWLLERWSVRDSGVAPVVVSVVDHESSEKL